LEQMTFDKAKVVECFKNTAEKYTESFANQMKRRTGQLDARIIAAREDFVKLQKNNAKQMKKLKVRNARLKEENEVLRQMLKRRKSEAQINLKSMMDAISNIQSLQQGQFKVTYHILEQFKIEVRVGEQKSILNNLDSVIATLVNYHESQRKQLTTLNEHLNQIFSQLSEYRIFENVDNGFLSLDVDDTTSDSVSISVRQVSPKRPPGEVLREYLSHDNSNESSSLHSVSWEQSPKKNPASLGLLNLLTSDAVYGGSNEGNMSRLFMVDQMSDSLDLAVPGFKVPYENQPTPATREQKDYTEPDTALKCQMTLFRRNLHKAFSEYDINSGGCLDTNGLVDAIMIKWPNCKVSNQQAKVVFSNVPNVVNRRATFQDIIEVILTSREPKIVSLKNILCFYMNISLVVRDKMFGWVETNSAAFETSRSNSTLFGTTSPIKVSGGGKSSKAKLGSESVIYVDIALDKKGLSSGSTNTESS